jgi:eukaryotic translation initiation factor 2-alpha kinase 4
LKTVISFTSRTCFRADFFNQAQLRSQELVRTFLDGPIAAIETKDDILEAIRDTRLSDPDSWRKTINNAPATERQYLGQVHELLLDMAKEGKDRSRNAFVFNFKTGSCIYYDLGRPLS